MAKAEYRYGQPAPSHGSLTHRHPGPRRGVAWMPVTGSAVMPAASSCAWCHRPITAHAVRRLGVLVSAHSSASLYAGQGSVLASAAQVLARALQRSVWATPRWRLVLESPVLAAWSCAPASRCAWFSGHITTFACSTAGYSQPVRAARLRPAQLLGELHRLCFTRWQYERRGAGCWPRLAGASCWFPVRPQCLCHSCGKIT